MKKISINIIVLSVALFYSGCATKNSTPFKDMYKFSIDQLDNDIKNISYENKFNFHTQEAPFETVKKENNRTKPPIIKLDKNLFNKDLQPTFIKQKDKKKEVSISVENIPIDKFIKLVFEQILKYNYTMSDNLSKMTKKVTLSMSENVTKEKLFNISEKILNANGVLVEYDEKTDSYFIDQGKATKEYNILSSNIFYGRSLPSNILDNQPVSIFIPTYYVNVRDFGRMFKKHYLSKEGTMLPIPLQTMMLLHDKAKNIRDILSLLKLVDTPSMRDKQAELIPLEFIDVNAFRNRMLKVLPLSGVKITQNIRDVGMVLETIPEINALFVLSDKDEWIDMLQYWKMKLDTLESDNEQPTLFIYKPKNRKASELKSIIDQLLSYKKAVKTTKNKNPKQKVQKEEKEEIATNVITDDTRNTLILYTTASQYKSIYQMLNKLDTLPKQVLIEIIIAELTLTDSLQYGLEWYLRNEGDKYSSTLSTQDNLGIGGGLVGSLVKNNGDLNMLFNAFAKKDLINVLSSPKLVVLDNQSASINVGTEVPIVTSTTTTEDATSANKNTTNNIEYRKTGTILKVTPTVNSDGTLTLTINQTISEAQTNTTSSIGSPMILNRSIDTNVVLRSNQSLLLGGLIKETKSDTYTRVPLLGDIPGLGNLFKSTSVSVDKTELLIVVKPIILNSVDKSNTLTQKFQQLLTIDN
jgi:general secretion pathway protein D